MAVKFTAGRFISYGSMVLCNRQKSVKFTKQVKATSLGSFFSVDAFSLTYFPKNTYKL